MFYKALHVRKEKDRVIQEVASLPLKALDTNEVLVRVCYSALNYKDALSASGYTSVTKKYPHTPGIDASGVVERSSVSHIKKGDEVIVTSYDLGMNTNGGFSEYISVPSLWVIPKPKNLSLKQAAAFGTVGLTVAIGLHKMELNGLKLPSTIIVSGASGAVGSFGVKLFSSLGYEVIAISNKEDKYEFLRSLGASQIIKRDTLELSNPKPLMKPKFDAGFDVAGGEILATLLKLIKPEGSIATCGLVNSSALNATVLPFILNGVNLLGINSAQYPKNLREILWQKLSNEWNINIDDLTHEHSLEELPSLIQEMMSGDGWGRAVIKID